MADIIQQMLSKYDNKITNQQDKHNALVEIMQQVCLSGLNRGGFFQKAAFYGGTCLRIFHGLNRFSEDLDFSLIDTKSSLSIEDYFKDLPNTRFKVKGFRRTLSPKKHFGSF